MAAGDIERWYRRYFPLIREKCRLMLGDYEEAQDLAQETFVRLWRAQLPPDDQRVTGWIYRTATRLAVDRLRARAVREAVPPSDATAAAPDGVVQTRQLLQRMAAQVPPDELECALLDRLDGLTQPETAAVLGCSERTVRRMLTRFDERLAALGWERS